MKKLYLFTILAILFLIGCQPDQDRKIKLAPRSSEDLFGRRAQNIQLAAAQKLGVAIFPFTNNSGDVDLDWMRQGFAEMLITQFSQFSKLNLNPSRQTQVALSRLGLKNAEFSREQTIQLGKLLDAGILITGDYNIINDQISLNVNLHDVDSGRIVQSLNRTSFENSELFGIVDDIVLSFRDTISSKSDYAPDHLNINRASITTRSVEAFAYYTKAMEAYSRLDHEEMINNLQAAIDQDSTFATALATMGEMYIELNDFKKAKEYYYKAFGFSKSISMRERLQVEAGMAFAEMDFSQSIKKYEELAELYPEDKELHYKLGGLYFSLLQNYAQAAQAYRTVLALDPDHKLALNQLAYCLARMGNEEESYKYLKTYINLAPEEPNPYDSYGEILFTFGHLDRAIAMFNMALAKDKNFLPAKLHRINAYIASGKIRSARRMIRKLKSDQQSVDFYILAAVTELADDHYAKAINWMEQYLKDNPYSVAALYFLNRIDPASALVRQNYNEWLQDAETVKKASINEILQFATIGLYIDESREKMQQLLQAHLETVTDSFLRQSGLALLQSFQFFNGNANEKTTSELMAFSKQVAGTGELTTSWEAYWYTFFKAAQNAYQNGWIDKRYFMGMYSWAEQLHALPQAYFAQIGLADFYELDGEHAKAKEILDQVATPRESDWSIIGPFDIKSGMLEPFWPEKSAIDQWFADADARGSLINNSDGLLDAYVNIGKIAGSGFNDCVYAILPITASSIQDCQLRMGSSGTLKIWLNNRLVATHLSTGYSKLDNHIYSIRLNPGTNWLMVRVSDIFKDAGFYFRITDQEGNPLQNLDFTRDITS